MLIRIGDEKREMIDAHLTVLKNKFVDLLGQNEPEMQKEATHTLRSVIENLPHKVCLYAALVAMMAGQDAQKTQTLVQEILTSSLSESFVNNQDGFKTRNVFRWLAYMVELNTVSATAASQFLLKIVDECLASKFQKDLVFHAVLTVLTTENVSAKLQKDSAVEFGPLMQKVQTFFTERAAKEALIQKALDMESPDSLSLLWKLYSASSDKSFPLRETQITVSQAKIDEIKAIQTSITSIPPISLSTDLQARSVSFDSHMANSLPPKRYRPLVLDLSSDASFVEYSLTTLCCDMLHAFQQNHKMAAQSIHKMYIGESLKDKHLDLVISALFSYIVSFHDQEGYGAPGQDSPKPIIFYTQVANIISQDLFEAGKDFIEKLESRIIAIIDKHSFSSGPSPFLAVSLIEFQVFLHGQLNNNKLCSVDFL